MTEKTVLCILVSCWWRCLDFFRTIQPTSQIPSIPNRLLQNSWRFQQNSGHGPAGGRKPCLILSGLFTNIYISFLSRTKITAHVSHTVTNYCKHKMFYFYLFYYFYHYWSRMCWFKLHKQILESLYSRCLFFVRFVLRS